MKSKTIKRALVMAVAATMALSMTAVVSAAGTSGAVYNDSYFKSVYGASTPHTVFVTFYGNAQSSRGFTWMTDQDGLESYVMISGNSEFKHAEIVPGDKGYAIQGADRTDTTMDNYNITQYVHKAAVTNLKAGKTYYYKVGTYGHWSDVGSFKTEENNQKSFSFIDITDTQASYNTATNADYYFNFAPTLSAAFRSDKDASFVMDNGDITNNGGDLIQWEAFADAAKANLMNTTFVPVAGNHETYTAHKDTAAQTVPVSNAFTNGSTSYVCGSYINSFINHFNLKLPSGETNTQQGAYYSFDYGNALIMVINTNALNFDGTLTSEQLQWMKKTSVESDKKWKIVSFHRAVQSVGSHIADADILALRRQLLPVMAQDGVDLVLQGHDHTYVRSYPIDSNGNPITTTAKITETDNGVSTSYEINPNGSIFVIPGASDDKDYADLYDNGAYASASANIYPEVRQPSVSGAALSEPCYAVVSVIGDKLTVTTYQYDLFAGASSVIDHFGILKTDR